MLNLSVLALTWFFRSYVLILRKLNRIAIMLNKFMAGLSLLALVFLTFVGGIAVSYLKLPIYRFFTSTWDSVKVMLAEPDRLMPAVHDFAGVRIHDKNALAEGLTLITSYFPEFDWEAGARLINVDGEVLHRWHIDPNEVFGTRNNLPYIHGSYLFPNGDLLLSYEFVGLARVSACGDVKWKITDPVSHHSVTVADDGTFWVSANRMLSQDDSRNVPLFKALSYPIYEDIFMQVSADGEILREISAIDVLDKNGLGEVYLRIGRKFQGDIFHLNDVEQLSSALAEQYPMFDAGDIAVSLRDLNMLLVVDPDTLLVKWYTYTQTTFQHDIDFIGDGWVGVFDNRYDRTEDGKILGGSRVLAIRPDTNEEKTLFPTEKSPNFYTKWSGKWQKLDGGNLLLTEARAGRALEVTADGTPVWEWVIERFNANEVPEVMEATRYVYTTDDVATWKCP